VSTDLTSWYILFQPRKNLEENKMLLEKLVTDSGKIKTAMDGIELTGELSNAITGTVCAENSNGIFGKCIGTFIFGDFTITIMFEKNLDNMLSVRELGRIIEDRITEVKEWIDTCKKTAGMYMLSNDSDNHEVLS